MKKVLVTGASRGIGQAIAAVFAQNGYEVIAPTRNILDLSDIESVNSFISEHQNIYFDAIINNAGFNHIDYIQDTDDSIMAKIFEINLMSPIRIMRGLCGPMKSKKSGRIVNIGSIWAQVSKPGRGIYSASKNGLHGVTNTLALELAPYNILVNTVCPGFVMTEMTACTNTPEQIESIQNEIPLNRLAQAEEIAKFVYFLGSSDNTYITGQKILIDGGYSVK